MKKIASAAIAPNGWTLLVNIGGVLVIIVWSFVWSVLMFGGLYYIKKLRIDRETEFKGNDLIKHGEAAYPRDAWVEMQYQMKNAAPKAPGDKNAEEGDVPPHMQQSNNSKEEKAYNNAFEMMPAFGMLHKASSGFMSGVTLQAAQEQARQGKDNKAMDAIHEKE